MTELNQPDVETPTPENQEPNIEQPWYESLSDDLKTNPTIQKYKSVEEMAKGLVNVNKLVGQKGVVKPPEDADPELWDKYYNDLGRPESADAYELSDLEDMPDNLITEDDTNWLKQVAHEIGMTNQQVNKLFEKYGDRMKESYASHIEQQKERQAQLDKEEQDRFNNAETKLRNTWQDKYDEMNNLALNTMKSFAGQDGVDFITKEFGVRPEIKEIFANIGQKITADPNGGKNRQTMTMTKQEIKSKIDAIRADKDHPYNNTSDPRKHNEAVKYMNDLYKML